MGGMMLESRYRHQLEADIRPFRDLLLGVFLVSVGAMLDLPLLGIWPRILAFGLILVLVKFALIADCPSLGEEAPGCGAQRRGPRAGGGCRPPGSGGELWPCARRCAGFHGGHPGEHGAYPGWCGERGGDGSDPGPGGARPLASLSGPCRGERARTHPCYGRVGQVIGRMLEETGVPYGALDSDPARVNEAALAGVPIRFGDAARSELQRGLGLEARASWWSASMIGRAPYGRPRALELNPTVPPGPQPRRSAPWKPSLLRGQRRWFRGFRSSLMLFTHLMALLRHDRADTEAALDQVQADPPPAPRRDCRGAAQPLSRGTHPVVLPEGARVLGLPAEKALPLSVEAVSLEQLREGTSSWK